MNVLNIHLAVQLHIALKEPEAGALISIAQKSCLSLSRILKNA